MDSFTEPESLVLPHTLSMHGLGPIHIDADTHSEMQAAQTDHLGQLTTHLAQLLLRPESLQQWRRGLVRLDDGLPLPEPLVVRPWDGESSVDQLESSDRRLCRIVEQLIQDERKSSKYFQQLQDLYQRHELQELALMYFSYAAEWDFLSQETWRSEIARCVAEHPEWLDLRLRYARDHLVETEGGEILGLPRFEEIMEHGFLLHAYPGEHHELTAYQFYLDMYMFFLLSDRFERAAYAFWQAHAYTSQPEALQGLTLLVLARCENGPEDPRFRELVRFIKSLG